MLTAYLITYMAVKLLIASTAGQDSCNTVNSVLDYTLAGHAYKTTSGKRLITCIISCDNDPDCYSLSYRFPTKTCDLSRKTSRSHPASFSFTPNWVYFDHPTRPAGSCVGDLPCRNDGKCENIPQAPGSKCDCRHYYIGDWCEVCSSPALGIQDKRIKDAKITASSKGMWLDLRTFWPYHARLHGPSSWVCSFIDHSPWLQLELPSPVKLVTRIATQGNSYYKWWTTSYTLKISLDGVWWREKSTDDMAEIILGNTDSTSVATHDFSPPFKAKFIKIYPLTKAGRTALRVEVYGCDVID